MPKTKHVGLVLLSSLLLLAASVIYAGNALAQNQATVTILQAIGGTTSPAAGTSSFNDGTSVTITATATDNGYAFSNWLISTGTDVRVSSDNPLTFTASGGTTYTIQPIFTVIQPINITSVRQNLADAAIVVILAAAGGTTIPRAGAYAFTNATSFNITAMPDNGWKFSHWVISGDTTVSHGGTPVNLEPTDNPYNVNHGYGSTYYYQAVFTQSGASTSPGPSTTIPEFPIYAILLIIGAMVIPVVVLARKRRTH